MATTFEYSVEDWSFFWNLWIFAAIHCVIRYRSRTTKFQPFLQQGRSLFGLRFGLEVIRVVDLCTLATIVACPIGIVGCRPLASAILGVGPLCHVALVIEWISDVTRMVCCAVDRRGKVEQSRWMWKLRGSPVNAYTSQDVLSRRRVNSTWRAGLFRWSEVKFECEDTLDPSLSHVTKTSKRSDGRLPCTSVARASNRVCKRDATRNTTVREELIQTSKLNTRYRHIDKATRWFPASVALSRVITAWRMWLARTTAC